MFHLSLPLIAAFAVWMMFTLFDWLVLDELWIGLLRPRWLVLPGTEHIPMSFHHAGHAVAFVKGTIGGAAVAAVVALAVNRAGAHALYPSVADALGSSTSLAKDVAADVRCGSPASPAFLVSTAMWSL